MDAWEHLETVDPEIWQVVRDEEERTRSHLELIASENYPSLAVLEAMGSILTGKYCHHAGRAARLLLAAGVVAAAGRLPDHPGHDPAPGASPDTIAALVTAPLERNFGQIPSLTPMTSSSSFGISQITLQFDLNRDIDAAAQDVQAAINASGSTLPRNLPYPPVYSKVNPADAPIVTLALTSTTISLRAAQRSRRHPAGAAAERTDRRRPRHRAGQHPAGGPHPGRSGAARQLRHLARGHAQRDRRRQCRRAEGRARRRAPVLHHRRQRPDHRGRRLSHDRHRLPQWRAGAARGRGRCHRRPGEQQGRRLVPGHPGRRHRRPAPARRQRHRDRRSASRPSCRGCSARCRAAPR